jgi:2-keto-3-deoxy-L-rhamnonate aldolase RhmA
VKQGNSLKQKMRSPALTLGIGITSTDPSLSEAAARWCDFILLDMEHGPLSLESVQLHAMALTGTSAGLLVRVPKADPAFVAPVLDLGADGVVFPQISTPEAAQAAVSLCRYPPEGTRGFGPRRSSDYGSYPSSDYATFANGAVIVVLQIEHVSAFARLEEILQVEGGDTFLLGPNDLAASCGLIGQPEHPRVIGLIDAAISSAHALGTTIGVAVGDPSSESLRKWAGRGVDWISPGSEISLMLRIGSTLRATADAISGDRDV